MLIGTDVYFMRLEHHSYFTILPNANWANLLDWINLLKIWIPVVLVIIIFLEILRIKGKVNSDHFFGLRMYEKKRCWKLRIFCCCNTYFILFFPQQIAIPCILCACLADPIMGEIRHRFGEKHDIVGFLVCMIFFMVTWYKADIRLMLFASVIGATGAVIGETKKFKWLDDDFMIQIVPAVLLLIVWFSAAFRFRFTWSNNSSWVMPW